MSPASKTGLQFGLFPELTTPIQISDMTQAIDAHAVALYLEDHPQFFDQHPDLIAGLKLTTTLGGRTVSLHERQVEVLREKVRQLELKLGNQGHVARDNQAIMEKFHQWVLRLLSADDGDRKSTRLNSSHRRLSRMPSSA